MLRTGCRSDERRDPRVPGNRRSRGDRRWPALGLGLILGLTACSDKLDSTATDGGQGADGGQGGTSCPGSLPFAASTCTDPACSATSGPKNLGAARAEAAKSSAWTMVSWVSLENPPASDTTMVTYAEGVSGGLSPAPLPARGRVPVTGAELWAASQVRAQRALGPDAFAAVFSPERLGRVRAEAKLRAMQPPVDPRAVDLGRLTGTAIRGRATRPGAPRLYDAAPACSATAPSCGATALCVIPEATGSMFARTGTGTCQNKLTLNFAAGSGAPVRLNATVAKVGQYGAIVIDDASAGAVQPSDVDALIARFDQHIAPLDHQFFGLPRNKDGQDRDGNGVVIILLTNQVGSVGEPGLVGFFQRQDLLPTSGPGSNPESNAADILYMLPPSSRITLDQLSGTIGHEYQHLINFYAKVVLNKSQQEDTWLDEGLATFAEDMLGYGSDAFQNVAAYLHNVATVSLTGSGLVDCAGSSGDSVCRRGMAHLLVRYLFEQKGGATWSSADGSKVTDNGGVAALHGLVQNMDTGTDNFTTAKTGRDLSTWIGDLLTLTVVSNAGYPGVSCNPAYALQPPAVDAFTMQQRGLNLHGTFTTASGTPITLMGATAQPLMAGESMIATNGGEVLTFSVPAGMVATVSMTAQADHPSGFRLIPTALQTGTSTRTGG